MYQCIRVVHSAVKIMVSFTKVKMIDYGRPKPHSTNMISKMYNLSE